MSTMSLEEVHQRLEKIPAKKFGDDHQTCAIGHLHRILTGKRSTGFDKNVYPVDVAQLADSWNDNLHPENRKALAMMLPLPEAFPVLTKVRAIKLALWAGEKALSYYDGPKRAVLERAVALARRAAAGEAYTEEEVKEVAEILSTVRRYAVSNVEFWVVSALRDVARMLIDTNDNTPCYVVLDAARGARLAGGDWRQWLEEYLKVRMGAKA